MRKLMLLALCFFTVFAFANPEEADERLPREWYRLPEEGGVSRDDSFRFTTTGPLVDRAIERVMRTNSYALDAYSEKTRATPKDWKLSEMCLSLSLSASGTLGIMLVKGDVSAGLIWEPKHKTAVAEDRANLTIAADLPERAVRAQLEPVVRAVMATGAVKDENALRRSLLERTLEYQNLVRGITIDPARGWDVTKLRLDITVDVSGMVYPPMTVGAGIALRFDFLPTPSRAKPNPELNRFIATVGSQLHDLPLDALTPKGFHLNTMRFGIGVYGGGKFGVVKVGASVMGSLYLKRSETIHPVLLPPDATLADVPILAPSKPEYDEFARVNGIRHADGVYFVPRDLFKKGLEKAARMGSYFAERADRSHGKKWDLTQISTSFALSLGGSFGVVSLGGTVSLQLEFVKSCVTGGGSHS